MYKNAFLWHRIYTLAKEIHDLAPWNTLDEDDIFGVKIPESGQIYFISIMGSGGEFTAISAYKGTRALGQFWDLFNKDGRWVSESVLTIPHIMLSFEDRNLLRKEHLEQIKASRLKFRGAGSWPVLDEIVPGYVPAIPEGKSLSDAVVILEQVREVARRAEDYVEFIHPDEYDDDVYLIKEMNQDDSGPPWSGHYRTTRIDPFLYRVKFREDMLPELNAMARKPSILQLDLALIPAPVKEDKSPGYFPFLLLLCNKNTGVVEGLETLAPKPDLDSLYESLPQKVMDLLMKIKYTPGRIEIRHEILDQTVDNLIESL